MQDTTAIARSTVTPAKGISERSRFSSLQHRFPTVAYLRRHARRHIPRFAFEYMDGGAGSDGGIARNWAALDAVELVPRYGITTVLPAIDVELFGSGMLLRLASPLWAVLRLFGRARTNALPPPRSGQTCRTRSGSWAE